MKELEKFLTMLNISKEYVLKNAKETKLSCKEAEAFNKGKEFIDKQMKLQNDNERNKVGLILLAYALKKYDSTNNKER